MQLSQQLGYLSDLLLLLNDDQYTHKIEYLGNASTGGHTRHIIELIQFAINGYSIGEVNYFNRTGTLALEEDRTMAQAPLKKFADGIRFPDKILNVLIEMIDVEDEMPFTVSEMSLRCQSLVTAIFETVIAQLEFLPFFNSINVCKPGSKNILLNIALIISLYWKTPVLPKKQQS